MAAQTPETGSQQTVRTATRSSADRAVPDMEGVAAKSYGFSWRIIAAIDGMAESVRAAVRSLFRRRARLEAEIAAPRRDGTKDLANPVLGGLHHVFSLVA